MENAGVTMNLRLATLCTGRWMRQTLNRTALKVGNQTTIALKYLTRGKIDLLILKTIRQAPGRFSYSSLNTKAPSALRRKNLKAHLYFNG